MFSEHCPIDPPQMVNSPILEFGLPFLRNSLLTDDSQPQLLRKIAETVKRAQALAEKYLREGA